MTSHSALPPLKQKIQRLVTAPLFEYSIIGLILLNARILGLETDAALVASYGNWFELGRQLILATFIIEALLKISAVAPRFKLYFGDGWNLLDFSVIVRLLLPATGELAMIPRLARLRERMERLE